MTVGPRSQLVFGKVDGAAVELAADARARY